MDGRITTCTPLFGRYSAIAEIIYTVVLIAREGQED
jgi:hypothetical protein